MILGIVATYKDIIRLLSPIVKKYFAKMQILFSPLRVRVRPIKNAGQYAPLLKRKGEKGKNAPIGGLLTQEDPPRSSAMTVTP